MLVLVLVSVGGDVSGRFIVVMSSILRTHLSVSLFVRSKKEQNKEAGFLNSWVLDFLKIHQCFYGGVRSVCVCLCVFFSIVIWVISHVLLSGRNCVCVMCTYSKWQYKWVFNTVGHEVTEARQSQVETHTHTHTHNNTHTHTHTHIRTHTHTHTHTHRER